MDITITNKQKVKVSLAPVTATGKPAKLDGKPTWTKQSPNDPDGATLDVAEDGLSAFLISCDTPGDTFILIEADADIGEGVQTISAQVILHVTGASAANFGITISLAIPK